MQQGSAKRMMHPPICTHAIRHALWKPAQGRGFQWRVHAGSQGRSPQVVLTREKGKNATMAKMLDEKKISWLELPLVESVPGPDREQLRSVLIERKFEWIVLTSPEAAAVFLECWTAASKPQVRIAVVGEGTGRILKAQNSPTLLQIDFKPSKADGKHLGAELPLDGTPNSQILFPASSKAGTDVQNGLSARGCEVLRLNTYDTVSVRNLEEQDKNLAYRSQVLTIASPSAIQAWAHHTQNEGLDHRILACIGNTSAKAAEKLGYKHVFFPDSPGMKGFLQSIETALQASVSLA